MTTAAAAAAGTRTALSTQSPRVEVRARLECFDAAGLSFDLALGAVQQVADEGADFVAEGGFGCCEGGLGDEFVVLLSQKVVVVDCQFVDQQVGENEEVFVKVEGQRGGEESERTLTVLSTEPRRGKSATPEPRVLTEDSRSETEVRSEATQSL